MIQQIRKITELEYYKFRHYRPFLIILGLYIFCFVLSGFSIKSLLDWFLEKQKDDDVLKHFLETGLPLFDFVDIWQNLGWLATLFKYIPAFVVIISVTLEYSQKTIKQNIIDGLSKKEFLLSKVALVFAISIGSALLLLFLGLFLGLLYSPVKGLAIRTGAYRICCRLWARSFCIPVHGPLRCILDSEEWSDYYSFPLVYSLHRANYNSNTSFSFQMGCLVFPCRSY